MVNRRLGTDEEPAQYVLATFNDQEVPPPFVTTIQPLLKQPSGAFRPMAEATVSRWRRRNVRSSIRRQFRWKSLPVHRRRCQRSHHAEGSPRAWRPESIQVFFPVFGSCGFDGAGIDPVYEEAAEISGGQVFSLDESEAGQIANLLDNVSRSTDVNILSIQDSLGPTPSVYTLPIDNTVTAVTFSISGDTSVALTRPDGSMVQDGDPGVTITNLSGADLFSIANPATGNWQISVSGSGEFSITVTGTAGFDLKSFDFVGIPATKLMNLASSRSTVSRSPANPIWFPPS